MQPNEAREVQIVVFQALKYCNDVLPSISSRVFEGMSSREIGRNLLANMRASLSTPAVFATIRILHRIQGLMEEKAKEWDEEGVAGITAVRIGKKNSVNYTLCKTFNTWAESIISKHVKGLTIYGEEGSNPFHQCASALRDINLYTAFKQFGVKV